MNITSEFAEKDRRIREMMDAQGLDALALSTIGNFAWITCGGNNYVGIATETGAATAVVTRNARYVICDNIEAKRIRDEEVGDKGFEVLSFPWHEGGRESLLRDLAGGGVIGSDVPMGGAKNIAAALDQYRCSLTPQEIDRYRWLGANTGQCLAEACREIEPGMIEHEIARLLDGKLYARGITPVVTLIAVDDRIRGYRHPIPTHKKLERHAMLVTGARRWGLIVSATRLVHFGEPSNELRCKNNAVAHVDGTFIARTVPGANVGEVFRRAVAAYEETGFSGEWKLHHQGGPTGYKGREYRANPTTDAVVVENQAFAWNPSITGAKSEDTIIATPNGPEILSWVEDWPAICVEIDGIYLKRPDVLVR